MKNFQFFTKKLFVFYEKLFFIFEVFLQYTKD